MAKSTRPPGRRIGSGSVHESEKQPGAAPGRDNLTYLRIVEQVTGSGISQQELSSAVGASVRSVQNWASGDTAPRGVSREKLLDLRFIVDELSSVYTDEGIEIWLRARNRNLGSQRPIDLLTAGDVEVVIEEVQRLSGAM
ncbi:MAG TPA: antitoxin Xre/MbcA/ParS toxin-binding domain-containing protein [Jatrophihabitans sp.]|uniref:antitoxin Xre/MbcA/ParS toxin-binding domain-containing protein n=1 Tax=Jatrophihabitans sp. TaxID=1932789 RepID=UPI002F1D8E68